MTKSHWLFANTPELPLAEFNLEFINFRIGRDRWGHLTVTLHDYAFGRGYVVKKRDLYDDGPDEDYVGMFYSMNSGATWDEVEPRKNFVYMTEDQREKLLSVMRWIASFGPLTDDYKQYWTEIWHIVPYLAIIKPGEKIYPEG